MNRLKEILFLKSVKGVGKATIYKKYWSYLKKGISIDDLEKIVAGEEKGLIVRDISIAREKAEKLYKSITHDLDINVITVFDEDYPEKLKVMGDKRPLILYVKGNTKALNNSNIAVVGTRHPSEWSRKVEEQLVKKILELSDRVVVSGLALGCDKIAHETTIIEGKTTVAVLPSGVNVVTPASHKKLAKDILETGGCLVSEYEPDVKASKTYYVERDAVVAAFSDITFVVECDVKSGTMHTVDAAEKYKRKLGCYYPPNLGMGAYAGNELMVNSKKAVKVRDTDDLIKLFDSVSEETSTIHPKESQQLSFEDYLKNV